MAIIPEFDNEYDFFEDDMEADIKLSLFDEERIKILNSIIKTAEEVKDNIKMKLLGEEKKNFMIISRYVSAMCDLNTVENSEEISDEEAREIISQIEGSVREISFSELISDINSKKISEDEEGFNPRNFLTPKDKEEKDSEEDDSLDF